MIDDEYGDSSRSKSSPLLVQSQAETQFRSVSKQLLKNPKLDNLCSQVSLTACPLPGRQVLRSTQYSSPIISLSGGVGGEGYQGRGD
jgi:hypothetical protein